MVNDLKTKKEVLRAEAKRARGLLSLSSGESEALATNFFDSIMPKKKSIIAAYWPKGRELDTHHLIDECLKRGHKVALPVIQKDSRILKFARYKNDKDLVLGQYDICHPEINWKTKWLNPDIFIVPLLAFDRRGSRLGYGGGYYDATLEDSRKNKDVLAVGIGYAQQACLFNLPKEDHDIRMDWIITQQAAYDHR